MLHIILFLLKLIGWILLAILGVAVLLLLVLLFTPLRYQVLADCDGDWKKLHADVRFSFLLHLIRGNISYRDGKAVWKLGIAWKTLGSEDSEAASDETAEADTEAGEMTVSAMEIHDKEPVSTGETAGEPKQAAVQHEVHEDAKTAKTAKTAETVETAQDEQKAPEQAAELPRKKIPPAAETAGEKSILSRLDVLSERIECTFRNICDKINALSEKKDMVISFLTEEAHKAAFIKVLTELRRILKKLAFRQAHVNLHFGFEDPSRTGLVLALLSMCYPAVKEYAGILPDFEQEVLEGDIFLKGRVRISIFAAAALHLLLDKNVRITLRHIKNLKF